MQVQDIYKLLYQGVCGPGHWMPDPEKFTERLRSELADLKPDPHEPLFEAIRPDGRLQRIALRACLRLNVSLPALATACLEAGRQTWGTARELAGVWAAFTTQVESGCCPALSPVEIRAFGLQMEGLGYPPVHHSPEYAARYRPAYRLVVDFQPGAITGLERGPTRHPDQR